MHGQSVHKVLACLLATAYLSLHFVAILCRMSVIVRWIALSYPHTLNKLPSAEHACRRMSFSTLVAEMCSMMVYDPRLFCRCFKGIL